MDDNKDLDKERQHHKVLYKSWEEEGHDSNGHAMPLRLAIEQVSDRGYSAHAYLNKGARDEDDMLLGSVDFAETGLEAWHQLKSKLQVDRGIDLGSEDAPNWLAQREWQPTPRRPRIAEQEG